MLSCSLSRTGISCQLGLTEATLYENILPIFGYKGRNDLSIYLLQPRFSEPSLPWSSLCLCLHSLGLTRILKGDSKSDLLVQWNNQVKCGERFTHGNNGVHLLYTGGEGLEKSKSRPGYLVRQWS
ncbi:hypothetical protein QVD17_39722 [Tagetes erecta]|uniref:Uncharacterized protein n=1 Tax=Tagetes erecta TaxID=13708 RepID=A0AAD8JRA8_TARER|nr:hypothetical protein QVD17_39722 [Tagetes erecta]